MVSETLTPLEAATEVRNLSGFEDVLRMRVEGLTWMLLGLVFCCTFLAYNVAVNASAPSTLFAVLWIPWLVMGTAVAWGIRRAMSLPTTGPSVWLFAYFGVVFLLTVTALLTGVEPDIAAAVAVIGFSALAAVPSAVPHMNYTGLGAKIGVGLALMGVMITVLAAVLGVSGNLIAAVATLVGAVWVAAGVYEILQG